jgi:hypothetical protein
MRKILSIGVGPADADERVSLWLTTESAHAPRMFSNVQGCENSNLRLSPQVRRVPTWSLFARLSPVPSK